MEAQTINPERPVVERELSGEKVDRIVVAMRDSVAQRGIAGATFDHVSREAGVSRGLLHYYFGTKERLLVEVLRREIELRTAQLDEPLRLASSADEVVDVLVEGAEDLLRSDPGFYLISFELFVAGRQNDEIRAQLAELYARVRGFIAGALRDKQAQGVISARHDPEAVAGYLVASADGGALQRLTAPDQDFSAAVGLGAEVARHLLTP